MQLFFCNQGDFDTAYFDGSKSPWASRFFFLILVVVVTVVVLNALIALLGDSYSQIQEKSTANKNMERAKLIVEYLSLLPKSIRKGIEFHCRYIHVLIPKQNLGEDGHIDDGVNAEWEGSVNAIRKNVESARTSLSKEIGLKFSTLDAKINACQDGLKHLNRKNDNISGIEQQQNIFEMNVKKKFDHLEEKIDNLQNVLTQLLKVMESQQH